MSCTQAETTKGLAIPYSSTDTGTRPLSACDGSVPYWTNPNIWLDHPGSSADNGTADFSIVNTVKVQVFNNSGADIHNVNVEAWVCDFTMGVNPASALTPPGAMTGYISTIAKGSSGIAACSPTWAPAAAQTLLNQETINGITYGHVCIAANAYGDGDGESLSPAGFDFCCNARHGQRNILIEPVSGNGPQPRILHIHLPVHALIDGGVTTVNVRRTTGPYAFTRTDQAFLIASQPFRQLLAHPAINPQFGALSSNLLRSNISAAVRTNSNPTSLIRTLPAAEKPFQLSPFKLASAVLSTTTAGSERVTVANGINGLRMQLQRGTRAVITLHVAFNANERVGNVHTLDFTQSDARNNVIGGTRVLALMV